MDGPEAGPCFPGVTTMDARTSRAVRRVRMPVWGGLPGLVGGLVLMVAAAGVAGPQVLPLAATYYGDLPEEGSPGWHVKARGIDHDASHWYLSQNPTAPFRAASLTAGVPRKCAVTPTAGLLVCPDPRLWRTPAAASLAADVSCGDPATAGPGAPACTTLSRAAPDLWALGYHRAGDIAFHAPDAAHGYVCVPLEGGLKGQADLPGAFAFFRADDLSLAAWAVGPGLGTAAAWCAIDETGDVYSSPQHAAGSAETVLRVRVDWAALAGGVPEARVELVGAIALQDENGAPLVLGEPVQGGTFGAATRFYLLNGPGDGTCAGCGIHAFELTHAATGGSCGASEGDCVARRVAHSTRGSGGFDFEFHPGWPRYEHPEGLTWWDLSAPGAPAVPGITSSGLPVAETQLHAMLLDDDYFSDDVHVKHYRVDHTEVPATQARDGLSAACSQGRASPPLRAAARASATPGRTC